MEQFPRDALARWAAVHPEILGLYVFGSRARGHARPHADLDLAVEVDDTRESAPTVLANSSARWLDELRQVTGLRVRALRLHGDPQVSGVVLEVFRRERT